ncbi:MAG: hypothetical protein RRY21_06405, partial [Oscillospiraceae bacterium]
PLIRLSRGENIGDQTTSVLALQAALDDVLAKAGTVLPPTPRVSYRYLGFNEQLPNPYGNSIQVGDIIREGRFVSTSMGKQFIMGKEQSDSNQVGSKSSAVQIKNSRVKMAVYGKSGVPIGSKDGAYDTKTKMLQQNNTGKVEGAGQAEVLYPRNTCFKVLALERQTNGETEECTVVVTEVPASAASGIIKDARTGLESKDPTTAPASPAPAAAQ